MLLNMELFCNRLQLIDIRGYKATPDFIDNCRMLFSANLLSFTFHEAVLTDAQP